MWGVRPPFPTRRSPQPDYPRSIAAHCGHSRPSCPSDPARNRLPGRASGRAGRGAEAKAMLDRRPDSQPVTNAYTRRLQLYRGEIGPDAVVTPADTDDVQVATLAYGLGNWHLVRGDMAQARRWFERSIQSGGWPGFGFIVSEVELRRLR